MDGAAGSRRRSTRLSMQPVASTKQQDDHEVTIVATSKRKTPLVTKQDRKVLTEASSEEELFSKLPVKKFKKVSQKKSPAVVKSSTSSQEDSSDDLKIVKSEDVSEDSFDLSTKENSSKGSPAKKVPTVKKEQSPVETSTAEMSEIEALRLKNIEERMKMFKQLNLGNLKQEMETEKKQAQQLKRSSLFSSKAAAPTEPMRKSARLQGMEAKKVELPPERLITEYTRRQSVSVGGKTKLFHSARGDDDWGRRDRNSEKELLMEDALHGGFAERDNTKLLLDCCTRMSLSKEDDQGVLEPDRCNLQGFKESMNGLTLKEQHKMKVVPSRIYSMAINPLSHGFLVAAGCKSGAVGLWNVDPDSSKWDESQVVAFDYHTMPTNCITFGMNEPHLMYTTSYDGTIRRADLQHQKFSLVYETPPYRKDNHACWHVEIEPRVLLLGIGDGTVARLDTREKDTSASIYKCHDRSLRTISVHPGTEVHFATTSSYNKEVAIWDLRKVSPKRTSGKMSSIEFPKTLSSAFFSPLTGNSILTTSGDDRVSVHDCKNLEYPTLKHKLAHNNHTGRWITNFRAMWHPKREDVFVIGSMDRPQRKVEIFEAGQKIKLLTMLTDDEYFTTIGAVSVFHPYMPAVASGNASGYVHVFM